MIDPLPYAPGIKPLGIFKSAKLGYLVCKWASVWKLLSTRSLYNKQIMSALRNYMQVEKTETIDTEQNSLMRECSAVS